MKEDSRGILNLGPYTDPDPDPITNRVRLRITHTHTHTYETHSKGKGLPLDATSADPEGEDPARDPPVHEGVPRED